MKKIEKVLIVGLGAIGSIYATKLHDFNPKMIQVLVDKTRYDDYAKRGIVFNNQKYDFDYVLDIDKDKKADLIIIATKASGYLEAVEMIENYVHNDTVVMALLNGISCEELLFEKYGREKVLYSYYIGHSSMREDNAITFDGIGKIFFGEDENKIYSDKILAVKELFDKVGIDYQIPEDMLSSMWQKFIINIGVNQTLAIVDKPYGALQKSIFVRNMAQDLMREAVKVAQTLKVKGTDKFIDVAWEFIKHVPSQLRPSMVQDIENNRKTEVDIFAGEICRLGRQYGVYTPKNEFAYNLIKAKDENAKAS